MAANNPYLPQAELPKGAFWRLFLCLCICPNSSLFAATLKTGTRIQCPDISDTETVKVKHVHDGDTVRLADGRKVRLAGIDTPELARDDKPEQPFANQARDMLNSLVGNDATVSLVYAKQRQDRYGRTLAHLYKGKNNLQLALIENGLAIANPVPPNVRYNSCYQHAERHARCNRLGFWKHSKYRLTPVNSLSKNISGFRIITTKLNRFEVSKKGLSLHMDGPLLVKAPQNFIQYFDLNLLETMTDKTLMVRGWIHPDKFRNDGLFMMMKHPDNIQILSNYQCD